MHHLHPHLPSADQDRVEVFCRLRPCSESSSPCAEADDDRTLKVFAPDGWMPNMKLKFPKTTVNSFTRVFAPFVQQPEVFESVALPLVSDVMRGKNGLLFTYGITGSGKTHSMTGNPRSPGLLPRCLDTLFNSLDGLLANPFTFDPANEFAVRSQHEADAAQRATTMRTAVGTPGRLLPPRTPRRAALGDHNVPPAPAAEEWEQRPRKRDHNLVTHIDQDNAYAVFVSYVEIYNNYAYDLLDESSNTQGKPKSKALRERLDGQMYVQDAVEVEVGTSEEAFAVFIRGQKQRRVAHTLLNTESSRSHSVFNVRVVQAPLDRSGNHVLSDPSLVRSAQLSLCDLAGSERSDRTNNTGDRMKETGNINQSLTVLRKCIDRLRTNQQQGARDLVPYRESSLTLLFKNYFDGKGKVRMVVCLNPSADDYEENLHVMNFAEATQEVVIDVEEEIAPSIDLVPGRRRAAQHRLELEAELIALRRQTTAANSGRPSVRLFVDMPAINLAGPDDDATVTRLRRHFEQQGALREQIIEEQGRKRDKLLHAMRSYVLDAESAHRENEENASGTSRQEEEIVRLTGENKALRHEFQSLAQRLKHYERDNQQRVDDTERSRRHERALQSKIRTQDECMKKINVITSGTPRRTASQDRINHLGKTPVSQVRIAAAKFGGSVERVNNQRATTLRPYAPTGTPSTSTKSSTLYQSTRGTPARGLASRPPTVQRRRSRSVGTAIAASSRPADELRALMNAGRKRQSDGDDEEEHVLTPSTMQKRARN